MIHHCVCEVDVECVTCQTDSRHGDVRRMLRFSSSSISSKEWNGIPIANSNSIDRSTIGAHAKATVSFWHKNDRDGTRAQTFTHMCMVYEMLYLPLYLFGFFRVDAVGSFVRKRCSGDEVDAVLNAS